MGAALSGSPKFKFLNAEGRGRGRGGEGRGKETFSCLPPYVAVPVLLKGLREVGGGGGVNFPYLPPHVAAAPFKRQFARLSSIADHIIYFLKKHFI